MIASNAASHTIREAGVVSADHAALVGAAWVGAALVGAAWAGAALVGASWAGAALVGAAARGVPESQTWWTRNDSSVATAAVVRRGTSPVEADGSCRRKLAALLDGIVAAPSSSGGDASFTVAGAGGGRVTATRPIALAAVVATAVLRLEKGGGGARGRASRRKRPGGRGRLVDVRAPSPKETVEAAAEVPGDRRRTD